MVDKMISMIDIDTPLWVCGIEIISQIELSKLQMTWEGLI